MAKKNSTNRIPIGICLSKKSAFYGSCPPNLSLKSTDSVHGVLDFLGFH